MLKYTKRKNSLPWIKSLQLAITSRASLFQDPIKDVIGLGSNQAGTNGANTIIAEGLNDPTNLFELAEDDGVKKI